VGDHPTDLDHYYDYKPHETDYDRCKCGEHSGVRIITTYCGREELKWEGSINIVPSSPRTEYEGISGSYGIELHKNESDETKYSFEYNWDNHDHQSFFENGNFTFNVELETYSCVKNGSNDPGLIKISELEHEQIDLESTKVPVRYQNCFQIEILIWSHPII
jgi:hypothetical protein